MRSKSDSIASFKPKSPIRAKPVSLASKLDIPRAAANFRVFADLVKMAGLESFQTETLDGANALNYAVRKPLGVVGIVTPWNLPLLLLTWKVAPALACGNTVVVKPSEETPATATLLAEAMQDAGIPNGVYNVVHGFGPGSAGEFLTQHPDVDAITFTGESRTGAAIMKAVAPTVKPVSFELGGKNAAIVFADCNFEETISGLSDAVFLNTGQVCLCAERVYVERKIFSAFVEALKTESGAPAFGLAERRKDEPGTADFCATSRKSAFLLPTGARRRGDGGYWRRSSEVWRRSRPRILRATHHLYWAAGIGALREGRNLWARVPHRAV